MVAQKQEKETKKPVTKKLRKVQKTVAKMENTFINDPIVNDVIQKSVFDSNIFMFLISQVNGENNNKIYLTSEMVREQIGYKKHTGIYEFAKKLDETCDYIGSLKLHDKIVYKDKNTGKTRVNIKRTNLFQNTQVDMGTDDYWCIVQMNKDCIQYFNNLKKNFTRFSVTEFFNIKSKYSRIIYLFLKQWRTVGSKSITPENLLERLNISNKSAKTNPTKYLRDKVLPIVKEELCAAFPQFRIETEKKNKRIVKYVFKWIREAKNQDVVLPKVLESSIALKNIRGNEYMTKAAKHRAIDRYYGWKIGTADKIIKAKTKNVSFFVYDPKKENKKTFYHRPELASVSRMKIESLKKLIEVYHNIGNELTEFDQDDLKYLESHQVYLQAKKNDKKAKELKKKLEIPKGSTIISQETQIALPNMSDLSIENSKQLDMFYGLDDNK